MQRVMAISASATAGLAIAAWGGEIWLTSSIPVAHLARFGRIRTNEPARSTDPRLGESQGCLGNING